MEIIDRILQLVEDKNITPNKLLVECKLPSSAMTFWKNGEKKPGLNALIKIADYFNVSLDYLVGREPQATNIKATNTTNDATTATLLNEWNGLTELQQHKVLTYINDIKGVNNNVALDILRKAETAGKERATKEVYMQRQKKDV